jgi:hypothetical protein
MSEFRFPRCDESAGLDTEAGRVGMRSRRNWLAGVPLLAMPALAGAAGLHFPTDDATVLDSGQVQLEGWALRADSRNGEFAVLPAVGIGGSVELAMGLLRVSEDGEYSNRLEPEAKWRLPLALPDGWGAALGVIAGVEEGRLEDWFVNLPLSYEFGVAPLALHLNTGWLRTRDPFRGSVDRMFTGIGAEWDLAPRVGFIGQVYREGTDAEPEAQLGLRLAVGERLDSLDVAFGRPLRGDDKDWFVVAGFAALF